MISIVCPFYNEEQIIAASLRLMLSNLASLDEEWELIIVSDGSRDRSRQIAESIAATEPRLIVLGYPANRGRGYAIRTGAAQARGQILVTTEIDSSWGDDIVPRLVAAMRARPDADIVVASPHLPGGGYKNVPWLRVFLSSFGNWVIRSGLTYSVTMNTGMTRAYKLDRFLTLPLDEDEKEMHIEVISKALAFGYTIIEIPAVLEWKDQKLAAASGHTRKSSARLNKLIHSHMLFSLLAAPFRYMYAVAGVVFLVATGFMGWAVANLAKGEPSIFLAIVALALFIVFFLIFGIGVLAQQGRAIQRELWKLRSAMNVTDKR